MKLSGRPLILGGIAIAVLILLTLLIAPQNSRYNSGSTYSRAPDGYGAWYAYMEERGADIQRWQKPLAALIEGDSDSESSPATLLRIFPNRVYPKLNDLSDWVQQGNTLVVLGADTRVTEAPFSTQHDSKGGTVKIDTSRRAVNLDLAETTLLGDRFGAVVWRQKLGEGRVIWAAPSFLGANAYQDEPGNYAFLDQLAPADQPIWVDEYIHGYKDADTVTLEEGTATWGDYLAKTPWLIVLIQAGILLLIAIWGQNRRFGSPVSLKTPVISNSEAYIQALAQVLRKADSHRFVVEAISKAERRQLQKELGLGAAPVEDSVLLDAWMRQTGRSEADLKQIFHFDGQKRSIHEQDLLTWLQKIQSVRQQ
ncbi:MAG: DUF4350 domain-containing protein [Leptolyngbyaceae cyanobacterium MO_188.B28]|nr:DUF4350 domain-containing protein [Leptolyngbyaceae cyanobacterium MO_188.B28]